MRKKKPVGVTTLQLATNSNKSKEFGITSRGHYSSKSYKKNYTNTIFFIFGSLTNRMEAFKLLFNDFWKNVIV